MSFKLGVSQNAKVVKGTESILKKRSGRLKAFCKKAASEAYAFQGFSLIKGNSENLETTAITRTIRNRNGHLLAP